MKNRVEINKWALLGPTVFGALLTERLGGGQGYVIYKKNQKFT